MIERDAYLWVLSFERTLSQIFWVLIISTYMKKWKQIYQHLLYLASSVSSKHFSHSISDTMRLCFVLKGLWNQTTLMELPKDFALKREHGKTLNMALTIGVLIDTTLMRWPTYVWNMLLKKGMVILNYYSSIFLD